MKHIKTLVSKTLVKDGKIGCGECNASCQSACKTSCTVGNQICKRDIKINTKNTPIQ
ncbi:MAG: six-cysteine ranthipeptide SCIFF [Christensenellaceae bacterium]|nr:six-cysteine ranthipeptide SCIFF [Christensenellaceae bacterium]